jgi:hypothetical protein
VAALFPEAATVMQIMFPEAKAVVNVSGNGPSSSTISPG